MLPTDSVISAQTLAACIDLPEIRVIDCRFSLAQPEAGYQAYKRAHLPRAQYANLNEDLSSPVIPGKTGRHPLPSPRVLAGIFYEWGIDSDVHIVAYDSSGGAIAARLWWLLRWLGHERVSVLDGGWRAWLEAGNAVTSLVVWPQKRVFRVQLRDEFVADANLVQMKAGEGKVVDTRAEPRFRGEFEPIDAVAGHIPGALSLPFQGNLGPDDRFLDKDALRTRFEPVSGDTGAGETIHYCGSGVTACHNLLAMHHAGLGDARLYPGSWSEWILDEARGVETG